MPDQQERLMAVAWRISEELIALPPDEARMILCMLAGRAVASWSDGNPARVEAEFRQLAAYGPFYGGEYKSRAARG